jgi:hypothetical protein
VPEVFDEESTLTLARAPIGIYIFKPMILEARVQALQREGVDIGSVGHEGKIEEEIKRQNEIAKSKKKEAKEEGK